MLHLVLKQNPWSGLKRRASLLAFLLLLSAVASASTGKERSSADHRDDRELAVGYSLLYQEAAGIPKLDWLLAFKSKSAKMESVTAALMGYYKELTSRMEKLVKKYPAIQLNAKTMSQMEEDTRKSMGVDQAKNFAPLLGKTGSTFEREALIIFRSALDEQRHLVGIMLDKESEPGLREFLQSTQGKLNEHYRQVNALLERQYFTH
jgi:hypothetical protein